MGFACRTPEQPNWQEVNQQTAAANVATAQEETHLNRPDVYTPYGSSTWEKDPFGNDPSQYINRQTLNPEEQRKLDLTRQAQIGALTKIANYGPGIVGDALTASYSLPGQPMNTLDPKYAPDQGFQTDSGMWSAAPMQEDLNLAAAPGLPTADPQTRAMITDALYRQGAQYLDPQFAQKADQMKADLSNQGIFSGSEAYGTAQDQFSREQQQAYGDLRDRSIAAGGEEMARDFGMGMQAHTQGVSDIALSGQFHNEARNQQINQLLADMGARNAALTSSGNLALSSSDLYNNARQAQLNELYAKNTMPLNVFNSVLTNSPINNPNFQPYATTQVGQTPTFQSAMASYQGNMDAANARNNMVGQGIGAAGTIVAGAVIL